MKRAEIKNIPLGTIQMESLEDKEIFIFGTSKAKELLVQMLDGISYHLIAYCDNNKKLWGKHIDNIIVYSPLQLKTYAKSHKDCIIIIASAFEYEIYPQLRNELEITNEIILTDQLFSSGFQRLLKKKDSTKKTKELIEEICKNAFPLDIESIVNNTREIVIYSAPKVGNTTLLKSLGYEFGRATTFSQFHSMSRPQFTIEQKKYCASKVKKIITGIRDAVAQNLSIEYQFPYFHCMILGENGHNAQKVFEYYVMNSIIYEEKRRQEGTYGYELEYRTPFLIQSWFDDTLKKEFDIDVYEYSFDKEKGYSIYNIKGYEILIYQMERMDSLYDVFREFIGDFTLEFKKTNDGKLKWYKKFYSDFLENVALEKEYIEKTYSGKMMQHFYSKEDIVKFREKWEKHIIED